MKRKAVLFLLFCALLLGKEYTLLFSGNKEISSRELYDALSLHKPYFYEFYLDSPTVEFKDIDSTKDTIKNYYRSRGFYHANILHMQDEKEVAILIQENSPVIVKSLSVVSNMPIKEKIPFKEGAVFDANKFTQSKKDIKLLYAKSGFCNISLDSKAWVDIEQNSAYLAYNILQNDKCYFKEIEVKPTKNIDADILKSLLYIEEGDPFSTEIITKSYESIYAHEGISKAIIDTKTDDKHSVNILLSVSENEKPIRTQVGLGLSSDEGAMFLLGAKHRNFYGNLKTLGLETRVTQIRQSIKTEFDMPLLHRNSTGFEAGYENELFNAFSEEKIYSEFFLRQKRLTYSLQESIVLDRTKTYDSDDNAIFPKTSLFVPSLKLEWNYDTRDKILEATSGYFLNTQISGSLRSALSDASYYKFRANGGYLHSINNTVFGVKSTFGTLHVEDGYIPASYRFFSGGMYSNRAYSYRKLGPTNDKNDPTGSDSLLETTLEARFGVSNDFKAVLFSDTTFLGNGKLPSYDNGYYSVGFGVRYKTPIGPIAVDFGFDVQDPLKQYAIHFHIGELF